MGKFSPGVAENIDYYVYRLIDPSNDKTFYIGKGKGNRMFAHAEGKPKLEKGETRKTVKLNVIHKIQKAKQEVNYRIHRHGMTEKCALEVEAALIDAYKTKQVKGHDSDRGESTVEQLEVRYAKRKMIIDPQHKLLFIKTKWTTVDDHGCVYEAVRRAWKIDRNRANRANFILAIIDGVCAGIFKSSSWIISPGDEKKSKREQRSEFRGDTVLSKNITDRYYNKVVPDEIWKPGATNPIRYVGPY